MAFLVMAGAAFVGGMGTGAVVLNKVSVITPRRSVRLKLGTLS